MPTATLIRESIEGSEMADMIDDELSWTEPKVKAKKRALDRVEKGCKAEEDAWDMTPSAQRTAKGPTRFLADFILSLNERRAVAKDQLSAAEFELKVAQFKKKCKTYASPNVAMVKRFFGVGVDKAKGAAGAAGAQGAAAAKGGAKLAPVEPPTAERLLPPFGATYADPVRAALSLLLQKPVRPPTALFNAVHKEQYTHLPKFSSLKEVEKDCRTAIKKLLVPCDKCDPLCCFGLYVGWREAFYPPTFQYEKPSASVGEVPVTATAGAAPAGAAAAAKGAAVAGTAANRPPVKGAPWVPFPVFKSKLAEKRSELKKWIKEMTAAQAKGQCVRKVKLCTGVFASAKLLPWRSGTAPSKAQAARSVGLADLPWYSKFDGSPYFFEHEQEDVIGPYVVVQWYRLKPSQKLGGIETPMGGSTTAASVAPAATQASAPERRLGEPNHGGGYESYGSLDESQSESESDRGYHLRSPSRGFKRRGGSRRFDSDDDSRFD